MNGPYKKGKFYSRHESLIAFMIFYFYMHAYKSEPRAAYFLVGRNWFNNNIFYVDSIIEWKENIER